MYVLLRGAYTKSLLEHGWDKLVVGCLMKHIQAQKVQYRPVHGLCKSVFNNTGYFQQDFLTSGDLIELLHTTHSTVKSCQNPTF